MNYFLVKISYLFYNILEYRNRSAAAQLTALPMPSLTFTSFTHPSFTHTSLSHLYAFKPSQHIVMACLKALSSSLYLNTTTLISNTLYTTDKILLTLKHFFLTAPYPVTDPVLTCPDTDLMVMVRRKVWQWPSGRIFCSAHSLCCEQGRQDQKRGIKYFL